MSSPDDQNVNIQDSSSAATDGHISQSNDMNAGIPPQANYKTPQFAEDSDLIEKAWVDKAKEIVEHTKYDPFEQQKAMTKFRADYMKKRYNKDISVHET